MDEKRSHTRREFMETALAAGASFALARGAKGAESIDVSGGGDSQKPLVAEAINQPDEGICMWVGFSPATDQTAFVAGAIGEARLYVSRAGQSDSFDILWEPEFNVSAIHGCAWSPNGKEIAFLVQAGDEKKNSMNARVSIFVAEVALGTVREPVIIAEARGGERKRLKNISYKKNLSWWNDACICVPTDNGKELLKFDTHTGQSEELFTVQDDTTISSPALTRNGELRFIKYRKREGKTGGQYLLGGLKQDGIVVDYGDLSAKLGQIFFTRLSQDGDFVFMEKREAATESMPMPQAKYLIYKIETRSVIGQIPVIVYTRKDMYHYLPITVQNGNELIMIEMTAMAVDGSKTEMNYRGKAVKLLVS